MNASNFTKVREAGSSHKWRPRRGWRPSSTHLLVALAAVAAFGLNIAILQDRDAVVRVAVADGPLEPGSSFDGSDVRLVEVNADFEGLSYLLTADEVSAHTGWLVARPVGDGHVIDKTILVPGEIASGNSAMAIPVGVEHAAGGVFKAGDRVDVISVAGGQAEFVLRNAAVVRAPPADRGGFGSVGGYYVVVEVTSEQALTLALAMSEGSLEVLQATPGIGEPDGA